MHRDIKGITSRQIRAASSAIALAALTFSACQKKSAQQTGVRMLADSAAPADATREAAQPANQPVRFPVEQTPAAAGGDRRVPGMIEDTASTRARGTSEVPGKPMPIPQETRSPSR
jgi:hypothetical protein